MYLSMIHMPLPGISMVIVLLYALRLCVITLCDMEKCNYTVGSGSNCVATFLWE